jgi:hypothetical protein
MVVVVVWGGGLERKALNPKHEIPNEEEESRIDAMFLV